ncbi:MAG TPA: tetratricopeptide repeat protein [Pyrinomonadaceae bacterium]|nr:tetratricopeptide repeat protein [Pyrinomonadaceae bacterium]
MATETLLRNNGVAVNTQQSAGSAFRAAWNFSNIGEYEAAKNALRGFWDNIGERPRTEGLAPVDQAELLLRAGALSGWLGSTGQVQGAQQFAKDLITESMRSFEALGYSEKVAEAQTDLAVCYWREGAMDEARVWFQSALALSTDPTNQLRSLVNSTTVEVSTNHLDEALTLLNQAAPLLDRIEDTASLGRFHMQRGIVYRRLGGVENLDRALIDHTAARIHFEKANHRRYFARAQNNIGGTLLDLKRYDEALDSLEDARRTFVELNDVGAVAQVNETRARVYLAKQKYADAEKIALASASVLERGGEQSLLVETLQTLGIAQARQKRFQPALATLQRAISVAETAGDPESSGRVYLAILEELNSFLPANELCAMYAEADRRLGEDLSHETMLRLRASARLLSPVSQTAAAPARVARTSFEEEVRRCESTLIREALDEANGSVTRAAKILGLTHQGLCYIINHRHRSLLDARAPIRVRRKSVMKRR